MNESQVYVNMCYSDRQTVSTTEAVDISRVVFPLSTQETALGKLVTKLLVHELKPSLALVVAKQPVLPSTWRYDW